MITQQTVVCGEESNTDAGPACGSDRLAWAWGSAEQSGECGRRMAMVCPRRLPERDNGKGCPWRSHSDREASLGPRPTGSMADGVHGRRAARTLTLDDVFVG